ncbi:hypothetical protein [Lonsdalea quercina]|uniref:hypothetical protein n=1 Tax=Lonsdalea quercina TaxID=71657 RepID=UPI0039753973
MDKVLIPNIVNSIDILRQHGCFNRQSPIPFFQTIETSAHKITQPTAHLECGIRDITDKFILHIVFETIHFFYNKDITCINFVYGFTFYRRPIRKKIPCKLLSAISSAALQSYRATELQSYRNDAPTAARVYNHLHIFGL